MLQAAAIALAVHTVALVLIGGAAVRICRRLGLEPREVLVWFGLAERPPVHSRQRVRPQPA